MNATQRTPGPLTVTRHDTLARHANVESDWRHRTGAWEDVYVDFGGFFGSYGPQLFAAAPELLAAAVKHLDALEKEAKANLTLSNAAANFSSSKKELERATRAMLAASQAGKELRAVIAKVIGSAA